MIFNMKNKMNKINKIGAALLIVLGTAFLGGCIKEGNLDAPPVITPSAGLTANMTLAQLTQFYVDSMASGFGIINKDIIIKGVVIANDESGNIYKTLYLKDNSGGINVALDQTNLYTTYTLGQRIYIKCKGLYLGNYGGVMELGYTNAGVIGRIPSTLIKNYLLLDSFPQNPPVPKLITIPTFTNSALCTLVKIDSVQFTTADIGQPFSTSTASTNHTLQDSLGNTVIVRTSNYANFAASPVPSGVGSVIGVLSSYSGTWQLYIRDLTDLKGFKQ
jgi:hypothetical protein